MDFDQDFWKGDMPSPPEGFEDFVSEESTNNSPNAGNNSALEQDSIIPKGWKPTVDKPLPVVRCTGTVRNGAREGERCGRWSISGHDKCMVHGGQLPSVQEAAAKKVEAAKLRLIADADLAIDTLFELIKPGTADQVRLGASKEILDRAGIKGAVDMNINVNHTSTAAEDIQKKLAVMAERMQPKEIEPEDLGELEEDSENLPEEPPREEKISQDDPLP
jgi:hypothetical protein